ncbi:unnamed protein product [Sphenostylis stenocarpa]|uniref:Translation elongation factor P/YeiP central domain-containing protein n=1 Tax=Sphenostylis stenocarpa TaxID=92480 RepID=A0AA86V211_9FABA|nr:unnamed protein product [Sphenostylis stenocarpa]
MQTLWLRLRLFNSDTKSLVRLSSYLYSSSCSPPPLNLTSLSSPLPASSTYTNLFTSPWSSSQCRGIKVSGSDIRVGNIIGKQGFFALGLLNFTQWIQIDMAHLRGKECEVVMVIVSWKAGFCTFSALSSRYILTHRTISLLHNTVELRDIGQGNKVTQRMGTDDDIERVYVQEKTFMFMCMDSDGTVVLMDPDTLDQIEVSKDLFNKDFVYLRDKMKVKVQFYDDKPLSASVPKRVTCIVKEAIAATPRYVLKEYSLYSYCLT